jgi:hypothetical protein
MAADFCRPPIQRSAVEPGSIRCKAGAMAGDFCRPPIAMFGVMTEPRDIVQRNPDGTFTKETLQRAMKALRKRLKLARLDDESRIGRNPMTKGGHSGIVAVRGPEQYPAEVWQELVTRGRLREVSPGLYEPVEQG